MNPNSSSVRYIEHIPAEPDRGMILVRLGYKKTTTVLDGQQQAMVDDCIKKGLLLCRVKGAFGRFHITDRSESFVRIEDNHIVESSGLAKILGNSEEVLLMSSTVGREIVDRIYDEIENGDAAAGVIFDAVASETADAGLDWLMVFFNKLLRIEGKKLTRQRFSPGYGDLALSNQKLVFDLLGLEKLNLKLTERFMLVPEKSVIAIAGIERIEYNEKAVF